MMEDQSTHKPVSILIPTYGAAKMLRICLASLMRHAPSHCAIHVVDDATPDDDIRLLCNDVQQEFPKLHYIRNEVNLGFVTSCNRGCKELREPGADLLLLNSDTEVTAGFLDEMQAILELHEKHAVVTPRSNSATIFSVPLIGGPLPASESFYVWEQIREVLPRYHIVPTAVGFCMLIKGEVLERFELFDEIYSPGYNEENDFVCRINRYGYSALSANRAYVFHNENSSFGSRRAKLECANRETLLERYPEYQRMVGEYVKFQVDPVETFAMLRLPHRPRILFDLFHLPPKHCGTSEFALSLLRALAPLLEADYDLYIGIAEFQAFFAAELTGYRIYEDRSSAPMMFDLVYKPCQIFSWREFDRMNRLAPRLCFTLLDIIAVRCGYLSSPDRKILFHKSAELSDCVFSISEFSRSDFAAYYRNDLSMRVIHLGTNFGGMAEKCPDGEYVLVMGNAYAHKGVIETLLYLDEEWPIVVLAGDNKIVDTKPNVHWLASGLLTRQHMRELLAKASVLVYPSHYEGFGLPVVDALALGKPVVVLDTAVNSEVAKLTEDGNLYRIKSLKRIRDAVRQALNRTPSCSGKPYRDWGNVAEEYAKAFGEILVRDVDVARLRARWDLLRTLESAGLI
jgi:GT2 family glycosyltransferase/glycosyltransferase involved in cell wall biosynthesis